jgi:hypothetical protein
MHWQLSVFNELLLTLQQDAKPWNWIYDGYSDGGSKHCCSG